MIFVLLGSFSTESSEVVNYLFKKKKGCQLHIVVCCLLLSFKADAIVVGLKFFYNLVYGG